MKVVGFIFLFHKFQSLALAKLYHRRVILSMFYFFYAKDRFVGDISASAKQNISLIFHVTYGKLKISCLRVQTPALSYHTPKIDPTSLLVSMICSIPK